VIHFCTESALLSFVCHYLLLRSFLFAFCSAESQAPRYDPGFPALAYFPQQYDSYIRINYGAAYGVANVTGNFRYQYLVENQPGRSGKFQLYLLDARNWAYFNNGQSFQCINAASCQLIGTNARSATIDRIASSNDNFWLVIMNRNALSDANLHVKFAAFRI